MAIFTSLAMAAMCALTVSARSGLHVPGGMVFHMASSAAKDGALASRNAPHVIKLAMAGDGAVQIPVETDPDRTEADDAMDRVRAHVPEDIFDYFDTFLYVSKASHGPLAQHMYIFHKDDQGDIAFEQRFAVSTGRERHEKYFTTTPAGLFELDPNRFERHHYSRTWHARMPWAMFLNASIRGRMTGIALHSADVHVAQLGRRASGGCVRLPPRKAAELFRRFQAEERGFVPTFAYDEAAHRTSRTGDVVRDADGRPALYYGYKVLVVIENYPGGPLLVAGLA
ncbi:MAG TPA: L,D-transpeptidase [Rhizomicrobium sp.]